MTNVFIIILIFFVALGIAALIHGLITAPTIDEDTNKFIHWRKSKAYFKKKEKLEKENSLKERQKFLEERRSSGKEKYNILKEVNKIDRSYVKNPIPLPILNKDGSVRRKPGPKLGSHNKKK